MKKHVQEAQNSPSEPFISRFEIDILHAYNFLKVRPTNKVTHNDVLNYANEYKRKTGFDPSIGVLVNNFTTEYDRKHYIERN